MTILSIIGLKCKEMVLTAESEMTMQRVMLVGKAGLFVLFVSSYCSVSSCAQM